MKSIKLAIFSIIFLLSNNSFSDVNERSSVHQRALPKNRLMMIDPDTFDKKKMKVSKDVRARKKEVFRKSTEKISRSAPSLKAGAKYSGGGSFDTDMLDELIKYRYVGPPDQKPEIKTSYRTNITKNDPEWVFVDHFEDTKSGYHVLTALSNDDSNSYLRITYDKKKKQAVATAVIDGTHLSIETSPTSNNTFVIDKSKYKKGGFAKSSFRDNKSSKLNQRHRALEMLSRMQLSLFQEPHGQHNSYKGLGKGKGSIHKVDVEALKNDPKRSVKDVLSHLSSITGYSESDEIETTSVNETDTEIIVKFSQKMDGILVNYQNSLIIEKNTGEIRSASFRILDTSRKKYGEISWLTETEAIDLAVQAVEEELGGEIAFGNTPPKARTVMAFDENEELYPRYTIYIRGRSNGTIVNKNVYIDGVLHTYKITAGQKNAFVAQTCRVISGQPIDCPESGDHVSKVITTTENAFIFPNCLGTPEECSEVRWRNPSHVLYLLDIFLPHIYPGGCCSQIGDSPESEATEGLLKVLVDSESGNVFGPNYDSFYSVIHLPGANKGGVLGDTGFSSVFVVHEFTHAYQHDYNLNFYDDVGAFAEAIKEGLADFSASWFKTRYFIPDPWKPYAGVVPAQDVRDLAATGSDLFYPANYNSSASTGHQNGRIIGHLFYHLSLEGLSNDELLFLSLRAQDIITPTSFGSGIGPDSLKAALDLAATGNTSMQEKIDLAWPKVFTTPPTPPTNPPTPTPGCSLPPAIPFVHGVQVQACEFSAGFARSIYHDFWDGVPSAAVYHVYYQPVGGTIQYAFSTTDTAHLTYNTVSVTVSVIPENSCGINFSVADTFFQPFVCAD